MNVNIYSESESYCRVPRTELARLQENMDPHRGAVAWGIVCDLLARPAEQHQGEPVALPERKGTHLRHDTLMPTFSKGWNACLDEIAKLGPLYNLGAVERLRGQVNEWAGKWEKAISAGAVMEGERNTLRAQLAERDALRSFADEIVSAAYDGGSFEGGDIQDMAVKHGLLRIESRAEECGETCACREYGFPAECYRKTPILSASAEPSAPASFQQQVQPWLIECFGEVIAQDREERNHRFLEEALELVQSLGCTAEPAHQLVDYVFGRAVGEPAQEVGGVMVTLAALCLANGLDMHQLADTELARVWTKVDQIREKQKSKPRVGPLPGVYPGREPSAPTEDDYLPEGIVEAAIHGQIISLPSAPTERDERADFEKHYASKNDGFVPGFYHGQYDWHDAQPCWEAWQARAALSASEDPTSLYPKCSVLKDANVRYSNSTAPVERDEPKSCDEANQENGPTFMGEPNLQHPIEWYREGISKHWKTICDQRVTIDCLTAALKFYADREHYHFESGNWDTVSGEPLNILWCGDEPDFIEDGTVARAALEKKS